MQNIENTCTNIPKDQPLEESTVESPLDHSNKIDKSNLSKLVSRLDSETDELLSIFTRNIQDLDLDKSKLNIKSDISKSPWDDDFDHFTPCIHYNFNSTRLIQNSEMTNQFSHFTHHPRSKAITSRHKHSSTREIYTCNSTQQNIIKMFNEECIREDSTKKRNEMNQPAMEKKTKHDIDKYKSILGGDITEEIINWVLKMKLSHVDSVLESDIVGLDDVKKMIKDKIIYPILRPDLHKGLHSAPKGILFFGPPGTGKTTLAKWIACQSNATFFEVSPSSITSKYHGETESIVRALFMIAEFNSPSVLFIDEVDSILAKRKDNDEDHSVRMKTQLLQMMDGLSNKKDSIVIVVGATNRPEILDDAALRRFTRRVLIPLPSHASRILFIKNILTKHQTDIHLENEYLIEISNKTDGWSGSDLLNLCTRAAEFSYDDTINKFGGIEKVPNSSSFRPITIDDFRKSFNLIKPSSITSGKLDIWESNFGSR